MIEGNSNGRKWFTALLLSPGMLFTFTYLAVWLSTNFYLDHRFRERLTSAFDTAAGKQYRLTIGDLDTSLELSSLTLKHLELIPVSTNGKELSQPIRIEKLRIACPEIGLFLFRPSKIEMTTRQISQQLLCRCRAAALSMNHESAPVQPDR